MRYAMFGGNGTMGKWFRKMITQNAPSFSLVCIGDNNEKQQGTIVDGIEIVDAVSFAERYHKSEFDCVIVSIDPSWLGLNSVIQQLIKLGVDKMYIFPQYLYDWKEENFSIENNLIKVDTSKPCFNANLNLAINRNCNLNCKGCGMFANLYKEECLADFNQYKKDLLRIKELFWAARYVGIFGGEPLLNKEVGKYVKLSRELFPSADINVETNGILIPTCSDELLKIMSDYHARFVITPYTLSAKIGETIKQRCEDFGIKYLYRSDKTDSLGFRSSFYKTLDSTGKHPLDLSYSDCIKRGSFYNWHIKNGYISSCQFPLYIDKFNERFSNVFTVSDEDVMNIYDESLDGYRLLEFLTSPKPFCKYCSFEEERVFFDWARSSADPQMSEWLVNEVEK